MAYKDNRGMDHDSAEEAYASTYENQNSGSGSSGGGGDGTVASGAGILIMIILAIPSLAAKIAGVIFGLLFKLGVVGKFLQTIIFSVVCVIITAFATGMFSGDVLAQLGIPVFLMAALWYWLFHYDEIKKIPINNFSNYATLSFAIVIFSFLVNFVFVAGIAAILFGQNVAKFVFFTVLLASFAIAIIIYLKKIKPYREEAARVRTRVKLKKTILVIAAAFLVLTLGLNLLTEALGWERKEINIDLRESSNQKTLVEPGTTAEVISDDAKIFPDLSPTTQEISILPKGTTVTVLAVNKRFPAWTEINHEGTKGWIESKNIYYESTSTHIKETTATTNDDVFITTEPVQRATVIKRLKKGDTVILTGEISGGFTQVTHNGDTGWIITRYLKMDKK